MSQSLTISSYHRLKIHPVSLFGFFVNLCSIDKDRSSVKFTLTNDNKQIVLLKVVSHSLKHQKCKSYNIFIDLPLNTFKNQYKEE